jgi:alpha-1,3-rhamnosyl/mannosyltransferase
LFPSKNGLFLKLYLDCSPLTNNQISGIGIYNKNLFLELHKIMGEQVSPVLKWNRLNKRAIVEKHLNCEVRALPPLILNKKILYHGTDHKINTLTLGPKVVTVHDMQPFVDKWLDHDFSKKRREIMTKVLNSNVDRVIAVSDFTKSEIIRFFPRLSSKIDVIYHGYDFCGSVNQEEINRLPALILERPFLLFIGNIEERKNLINQIKAFEILKDKNPDLLFIIAGSLGFNHQEILDFIKNSKHQKSIHLMGYLNETEKIFALEKTSCLMFASWYEGFGIPVIEALSMNTNVLISDAASLPEIGGQYCRMCKAHDVKDIAEKTADIIQNGNLVKINLEEWKTKWSWSKCARETIKTYQKIYI